MTPAAPILEVPPIDMLPSVDPMPMSRAIGLQRSWPRSQADGSAGAGFANPRETSR